MKLESLKSSKLEAFKENELLNTMNVLGGTEFATSNGKSFDTYDDASGDRNSAYNIKDRTELVPIKTN